MTFVLGGSSDGVALSSLVNRLTALEQSSADAKVQVDLVTKASTIFGLLGFLLARCIEWPADVSPTLDTPHEPI